MYNKIERKKDLYILHNIYAYWGLPQYIRLQQKIKWKQKHPRTKNQ